jgi:hypothetical protein
MQDEAEHFIANLRFKFYFLKGSVTWPEISTHRKPEEGLNGSCLFASRKQVYSLYSGRHRSGAENFKEKSPARGRAF